MNKLKKLFSTPRRIFVFSLCSILLVAAIGTGTAFAATAAAEKKSIGSESALDIALNHAGVKKSDANVRHSVFERENGQYIYDVEFTANGVSYDYTIQASGGAVLESDADGARKEPEKATVSGSAASGSPTASGSPAASGSANATIGIEAAKEIALKDAGLTGKTPTFTKTKLDKENGISVYDLEFFIENMEYDYEIHAKTGAILEKSTETIKTAAKPSPTSAGTSYIGVKKAKELALKDAGLSAGQVTFTKAQLDRDDPVPVYDIEFETASMEYDYEIHAKTGSVVEKSREKIHNNTPSTNSSSGNTSAYIGVDEAKNIALKHAALSLNQVTFSKAKMEKEDGVPVYEIEFYNKTMEYEYTISASTGKILEFDSEYND